MRYTMVVMSPWHPGPCSTVPSKFQSFGIETVPATKLNIGSLISTVFIGTGSVGPDVVLVAPLEADAVDPADAAVSEAVVPEPLLAAHDPDASGTTANAITPTTDHTTDLVRATAAMISLEMSMLLRGVLYQWT